MQLPMSSYLVVYGSVSTSKIVICNLSMMYQSSTNISCSHRQSFRHRARPPIHIQMDQELHITVMQLRWTRITALALAIAAAPSLAMWNESQVDREFNALYMLLLRTRAKAMQDGPMTVRFTGYRAVME